MRTANRSVALLVLLGLVMSLGDYPYVDEFFPADSTCSSHMATAHPSSGCPAHGKPTARNVILCYTTLASAMCPSPQIFVVPSVHGAQVDRYVAAFTLESTLDRIERPPAAYA